MKLHWKNIILEVDVMSNWIEEYSYLDLKNGEIKFICDDDQDMIEIR